MPRAGSFLPAPCLPQGYLSPDASVTSSGLSNEAGTLLNVAQTLLLSLHSFQQLPAFTGVLDAETGSVALQFLARVSHSVPSTWVHQAFGQLFALPAIWKGRQGQA